MHTFWYIVIAFFWTGFFVLEGFDFGVGMLHGIVGRTDVERRVAINAIGPFWDGNEVWLVVAGASMFAAFPGWYATMFSALYLALVIVLLALIVRGVSFEFRSKLSDRRWRLAWAWSMTLGSALVPLFVGVGLGDLLNGLPIDKSHVYTGSFFNLLTPYGLWVGVTLLVLSLLHGATFLMLKTTGAVLARARRAAELASWVAVAMVLGMAIWTQVGLRHGVVPAPLSVLAILAVVAAALLATEEHAGWAFAASAVAMGATVASLFVTLYPSLMVSTTNRAFDVTVSNAASGSYALGVMTVVSVIFLPLVLAYQSWSYYVFRKRVTGRPSGGAAAAESGTGGDGARGTG